MHANFFGDSGPGLYRHTDKAEAGYTSERMSKIGLFLHRYCIFAYGCVLGSEQKKAIISLLFFTVPA